MNKSIDFNSTNNIESMISNGNDNNQKEKTFLEIKRKIKHISIEESNKYPIDNIFSPTKIILIDKNNDY